MAEISTVARPYAEALFASAQSAGATADWQPLIERLAALVDDPQVAAVISDPKLEPVQVAELVGGLAGTPLPDGLRNLVSLLVENDRLSTLPEIAQQYHALKNHAEGTADCLIETALPLEPAQLADLVAALTRKFTMQLNPEVRVDPSLIGGVRVTVGDQVLDTTVRARLDAMRTALTAA